MDTARDAPTSAEKESHSPHNDRNVKVTSIKPTPGMGSPSSSSRDHQNQITVHYFVPNVDEPQYSGDVIATEMESLGAVVCERISPCPKEENVAVPVDFGLAVKTMSQGPQDTDDIIKDDADDLISGPDLLYGVKVEVAASDDMSPDHDELEESAQGVSDWTSPVERQAREQSDMEPWDLSQPQNSNQPDEKPYPEFLIESNQWEDVPTGESTEPLENENSEPSPSPTAMNLIARDNVTQVKTEPIDPEFIDASRKEKSDCTGTETFYPDKFGFESNSNQAVEPGPSGAEGFKYTIIRDNKPMMFVLPGRDDVTQVKNEPIDPELDASGKEKSDRTGTETFYPDKFGLESNSNQAVEPGPSGSEGFGYTVIRDSKPMMFVLPGFDNGDNLRTASMVFDQAGLVVGQKRKRGRKRLFPPGEKPYVCNSCGKGFKRNSQLVEHYRVHTGERPFKCDICDKAFTQNAVLTQHKRTHTGEKPFKCDLCDKMFTQNVNLRAHKRIHEEKSFRCDQCGRGFKDEDVLNQHKSFHELVCDICGREFKKNSNLLRHKRTHTGERPFTCKECDKTFVTKSHMMQHQRVHSGERPFMCHFCGKGFSTSGNLEQHKRSHTGERPFPCPHCERTFARTNILADHIARSHSSGEKLFACDKCDKTFICNSNLLQHKRSHITERPLQCDVCYKWFSNNSSLSRHVMVHGERPYKCDLCAKSFTHLCFLNMHMKCHAEDEEYKCHGCGKKFIDVTMLNSHIKAIHAPEPKFKCEHCNSFFTESEGLEKHQQDAHAKKVDPANVNSPPSDSRPNYSEDLSQKVFPTMAQ